MNFQNPENFQDPENFQEPGSLAVLCQDAGEEAAARATRLASRLGLSLLMRAEPEYDLFLAVTDQRLELRLNEPKAPGPLHVDFLQGALGYNRRINPHGQLLKAICGQNRRPTVLDATAGLGHDAFILAHKGLRVTAVERSPVLVELVKDAMARASTEENLLELLNDRLHLICADARDYLQILEPAAAPEVIYLDPMFPPKKKSALVKKEMRMVRRLVGDDQDGESLLALARPIARHSVVVKRPAHAPPLAADPDRTYKGKTARYDVYQG